MNKTEQNGQSNKDVRQDVKFEQLVNTTRGGEYLLSTHKKVLELPLHFKLGMSIEDSYKEFYDKYVYLLERCNVNVEIINIAYQLGRGLLDTVRDYLNGKIVSAYNRFEQAMSQIANYLPLVQVDSRVFYRMRNGKALTDIKEFWHIPFDKNYLSRSERFSIEGYPILYLGYSKHVCELEIQKGSLAALKLNESIDRVLDLTLGQGDGKRLLQDSDLMKIYPLIASCYVVPYYSVFSKTICAPDNPSFREEYIIPQFLTVYLKEKGVANGIIYYTVKDPNLNPNDTGEKDPRNLALFTTRVKGKNHDEELMNKFTINI